MKWCFVNSISFLIFLAPCPPLRKDFHLNNQHSLHFLSQPRNQWKVTERTGNYICAYRRLSAVLQTAEKTFICLILSYLANISQTMQTSIIYYSQRDLFAVLQIWQVNSHLVPLFRMSHYPWLTISLMKQ